MSKEIWKPVVGLETKYEVSSFGRIRSIGFVDSAGRTRHPRILKATGNSWGRLQVDLHYLNGQRKVFVHRLVLEAFVGPCPEGMEACHWDDDPSNNRLSNLRWDTHSENFRDMVRNGNHRNARKTHCKRGHEFTPENTYVPPVGGVRQCRKCNTIRRAKRRLTRAVPATGRGSEQVAA